MMKLTIYIALTIFFSACSNSVIFEKNKTPLAKVGEEVLYYEDIQHLFGVKEFSAEDSAKLITDYIEKWSIDQMLYALACNNVHNSQEIDKLVEQYRRMLYIYAYQQQYVEANIPNLENEEVKEYFNENKNLFLQDEKLLKGLFVALPLDLDKGNKIRKLLRNYKQENIEKIEKFSFANAVSYDYFIDSWVEISKIEDKLPIGARIELIEQSKKTYEFSDSIMTYIVYVDSIVNVGEVSPFDYARKSVEEILYNQKKMEYINNLKPEVYKNGLSSGRIQLFEIKEAPKKIFDINLIKK